MKVAKPIQRLAESLQKLPGIGPKSAMRLTFYMLRVPQSDLEEFAEALSTLKKETKLCSVCRNVSETDPCPVCADGKRDTTSIMVVEEPMDLLAFERTGKYSGLYHVLHGAINPLDNIGPDELYMQDLINRLHSGKIEEIIIATNPTMEGEATAMYLKKKIREIGNGTTGIKITRLGMGIPTGADLEYADETTLSEALSGRRELV
jgi:recombination protein RecR